VSPRRGATRKNLSMFLMADRVATSLRFPEEKEDEGTLMSTSAVQHAALACYGVSRMTDVMTSRWRWPLLRLTTRLRSKCSFPSALFTHAFTVSLVVSLAWRGIQPSMILLPPWPNLSLHSLSRPTKYIFYQNLPISTHD
jgi:hypothetical protein